MNKRKRMKSPTRRSVKEWIGKTPDSVPPPTVKERILERQGWKCALTPTNLREVKRNQIRFDHATALIDGGENRESNIQAVHEIPHRAKSAAENKRKSATVRKTVSHYGLKEVKRPIPQRPKALVERKTKHASHLGHLARIHPVTRERIQP